MGILKLFGILLDGRDRKSAENYVLKHINGGVITSTQQLNNEDRVMILLKESLMQSSGTITPSMSEHKMGALKNVTGTGGSKINFNNLEQPSKHRDEFLEKQIKDGHFKGLNKLFKHDQDTVMRHTGLIGPSVPPGMTKKKGSGLSK